ncbi:hypothetical protein D6851_10165 [Altericroceibacterium spongiae]|uniref:Uncharacterized protein n=1 Tax=Altericroceibacterium spongiae TaxID=2320269 RepID=A0A420EIL0_9SPHN|nr:hypothetical protein [Altericroceibacterium spongiae]RKF20508.1 hypothetical protein D6851_10165 [Altericroceibacterium spongiae]
MLYHASIAAKDPENVSKVVAEIWGGEHFPFLPLQNGSWMAVASDDRNTALEVYPHNSIIDYEDPKVVVPNPAPSGTNRVETHLAIGTGLTADDIFAIGEREGWFAQRLRRKMGFDVVELWIENRVMLEILTEEMQSDYLETTTTPRWMAALEKWKEAKLG